MTGEWFIFYGLAIGLSYQEVMALPFGRLQDLIAIFQIKNEGAKRKKTMEEETADFERLMAWK